MLNYWGATAELWYFEEDMLLFFKLIIDIYHNCTPRHTGESSWKAGNNLPTAKINSKLLCEMSTHISPVFVPWFSK